MYTYIDTYALVQYIYTYVFAYEGYAVEIRIRIFTCVGVQYVYVTEGKMGLFVSYLLYLNGELECTYCVCAFMHTHPQCMRGTRS